MGVHARAVSLQPVHLDLVALVRDAVHEERVEDGDGRAALERRRDVARAVGVLLLEREAVPVQNFAQLPAWSSSRVSACGCA